MRSSAIALALISAAGLSAGTFQAQLTLNLGVPLNGVTYSVMAGNADVSPGLFYNEYGFAAVTQAQPGSSSYDQDPVLIGLIPVNLMVTAGPVAGFAAQWGHSDAASLISSNSFEIDNRNAGLDIDILFNYTLFVSAQKFTDDENEYSNARVMFQFINVGTGDQLPFIANNVAVPDVLDAEVRRDPEDPAGNPIAFCNNCQGKISLHLDANQSIEIAVLASAQGNATWLPEPGTGFAGFLAIGLLAGAARYRVRRVNARNHQ